MSSNACSHRVKDGPVLTRSGGEKGGVQPKLDAGMNLLYAALRRRRRLRWPCPALPSAAAPGYWKPPADGDSCPAGCTITVEGVEALACRQGAGGARSRQEKAGTWAGGCAGSRVGRQAEHAGGMNRQGEQARFGSMCAFDHTTRRLLEAAKRHLNW